MARNILPPNMKEPIISCIRQRLEEKKEFDMDKLISHLSKDLVTKIKNHLCLPLLQKVSFFFFFIIIIIFLSSIPVQYPHINNHFYNIGLVLDCLQARQFKILKIKVTKICWPNGSANLSSQSTTLRTSKLSRRENQLLRWSSLCKAVYGASKRVMVRMVTVLIFSLLLINLSSMEKNF